MKIPVPNRKVVIMQGERIAAVSAAAKTQQNSHSDYSEVSDFLEEALIFVECCIEVVEGVRTVYDECIRRDQA